MNAFVVRVTKMYQTETNGQGVKVEDYFGPYDSEEDAESFGQDYTRDDMSFFEVVLLKQEVASG